MPTKDWLRREFSYGYDSGGILDLIPSRCRRSEEQSIGGSYRKVFRKAILPCLKPNSTVLELGPGAGSWSRAMLRYIPKGRLYTVDFQDVTNWLEPQRYNGRLICNQVSDNSFSCIENDSIDFFWSFGVLCHNNVSHIKGILENALPKMRKGGIACHQYSDWEKLDIYGWRRGRIPVEFKEKSDDDIWWPRNSGLAMGETATKAGWSVVTLDLDLVKRDGLILMKRE